MKLKAIYKEDIQLLATLCPAETEKLEAWFVELNSKNVSRDGIYSSPIEAHTGIKCWYDFFMEGYTPEDALEEDLRHAD